MESWQLPDNVADVLPTAARKLENAKEALLSLFKVHGYQLVNPPLMEYTHSLLTRIDPGLSIKTMRVVDQISGRQLGIRADITPQISRIDAHLLSRRDGVNRLCYAAPVLHATPQSLMSTREPLQIGAEMYGLESLEADLELMDLMFKSLAILEVEDPMLSLGHVGVFNAIVKEAGVPGDAAIRILGHMQSKDVTELERLAAGMRLKAPTVEALIDLCNLYGGPEIIEKARKELPDSPGVGAALDQLELVMKAFPDVPAHVNLGEIRVDHYHTGLLFGVYCAGWSQAIMRGGRYDGLGRYFGRSRFATGFSFDLKDFVDVLPEVERSYGIAVDRAIAKEAKDLIDRLRSEGGTVIVDYLGEGAEALSCDRRIVKLDKGGFDIAPI